MSEETSCKFTANQQQAVPGLTVEQVTSDSGNSLHLEYDT